jgi:hypothetical protein
MSIAMKDSFGFSQEHVAFEVITPAAAAKMLQRSNFRNRNLNNRQVDQIAQSMQLGRFKLNGETIKLDDQGNVFDGQHRLHAIIKSQIPVRICVARNLDQSVFDTVDKGRKRTDADILGIKNEKNTATLSAALRIVNAYLHLGSDGFNKGEGSIPYHRVKHFLIADLLESHCDIRHSVNLIASTKGKVRPFHPAGLISAIHYLFGKLTADSICRDGFTADSICRDEFFERLRRNDFRGQTCPARSLFMAYQSETDRATRA